MCRLRGGRESLDWLGPVQMQRHGQSLRCRVISACVSVVLRRYMQYQTLTKYQLDKRSDWVAEISNTDGNFGVDSKRLEEKISDELAADGIESIIGHLRLCGAIPESYIHDSSKEKLYSKYTDVVLSKSFEVIGLTSKVLTERADAADVECVGSDFSFVADAKAFRLK